MSVIIPLTLLFALIGLSIAYVYLYRGNERYENFSEYLRKGWPIFSPLNCLLYIFTKKRAKKAIMDMDDYPELKPLQENWKTIAKEATALYENGFFDKITDPNSKSYYDIGFRTFYKYGWSKFYLNWYGYTHASAIEHCPETTKILKQVKTVNGAMFSILPVGSKLTRHLDPVASSLRYHLGLSTPDSPECYINVDGTDYSWKDGEAFMFDETHLHYAHNDSQKYRIILMCDVERPLYFIGFIINFFYKIAMRMSIVPNTDQDERGFANKVFAWLSPILAKTKALKETNKTKYLFIKHSVNFTLFVIILGIITLSFMGISKLATIVS